MLPYPITPGIIEIYFSAVEKVEKVSDEKF
jgi:hypothetical protein